MPWTAESFRKKHNHSLTHAEAEKAAAQANAILRSGGSEATAIATANKHVNEERKKRKGKSPAKALYPGMKDDDE